MYYEMITERLRNGIVLRYHYVKCLLKGFRSPIPIILFGVPQIIDADKIVFSDWLVSATVT